MTADESIYRQELRLRVCGLLVKDDHILLAQIHSPVIDDLIWTPPGGGLQYGETMVEGVKREFLQETNLQITVHDLLHINELVQQPFHAVEFYFEVEKRSGELKLGTDPELGWNQQLMHDLQWVPLDELDEIVFAPENLLPKLLQWNQRSSFYPFKSP